MIPDIDDSERTPCEVWTRVMGYHRPVTAFNKGKQSEHAERRYFRESSSWPGRVDKRSASADPTPCCDLGHRQPLIDRLGGPWGANSG